MNEALVIGIGNDWRGDDAAGLHLARQLRSRLAPRRAGGSQTSRCAGGGPAPNVRVMELSGEASELLEAWQGREYVVVVDAVSSGAEAGTPHRVDVTSEPLPAQLASRSTHGWGVAQAVELGRALGKLPRRLIIYGIEGQDFGFGQSLSPKVEAGVGEVAQRLSEELGADGGVRAGRSRKRSDSRPRSEDRDLPRPGDRRRSSS